MATASQEVWGKPAWPSVARSRGQARCLSRRRVTNSSCVCTHMPTPTHTCMLMRARVHTVADVTHMLSCCPWLPRRFLLSGVRYQLLSGVRAFGKRGEEGAHTSSRPRCAALGRALREKEGEWSGVSGHQERGQQDACAPRGPRAAARGCPRACRTSSLVSAHGQGF